MFSVKKNFFRFSLSWMSHCFALEQLSWHSDTLLVTHNNRTTDWFTQIFSLLLVLKYFSFTFKYFSDWAYHNNIYIMPVRNVGYRKLLTIFLLHSVTCSLQLGLSLTEPNRVVPVHTSAIITLRPIPELDTWVWALHWLTINCSSH